MAENRAGGWEAGRYLGWGWNEDCGCVCCAEGVGLGGVEGEGVRVGARGGLLGMENRTEELGAGESWRALRAMVVESGGLESCFDVGSDHAGGLEEAGGQLLEGRLPDYRSDIRFCQMNCAGEESDFCDALW